MNKKTTAILLLIDGTVFEGLAVGGNDNGFCIGELVFNTSMSGYQEVITDPSYSGQIVCFTQPHIGNYGINEHDLESGGPQVAGIVVREMTDKPSNQRATSSLPDWLTEHDVVGIEQVDTRALTQHLRDKGVMRGIIVHDATKADCAKWLNVLNDADDYGSIDFVAKCAVPEPMTVEFADANQRDDAGFGPVDLVFSTNLDPAPDDDRIHVVVVDYGTKWSIIRSLLERGARVTVVPYTLSRDAIDALKPDGILISNGPGDPAKLADESQAMRKLAEDYPTFGICLGHQLLAQGFGAQTFKLQFGHRGPNQPCLDHQTGNVIITSQNHGYAVDRDTIPAELVETSKNLNDDTVSGLKHVNKPIFSVQYHPEAGPGPNDAKCEFDQFIEWVKTAHSQ